MTTKDEALKQALEALTCIDDDGDDRGHRCGQCDDYVDRNGHVRAAIREALAQKDCECFAIALDAANRTKEACIKATGQKKNIETYVNAIQIAHDAAGTDFDACREALAQKDEWEPVAEITADDMGRPFNAIRIGAHFYKEIPPVGTKLYTAPPKRQPLTDEQRYALIKEHLGLDKRRDETVIDHRTGRWTDAARYFDLMDAAIVTAEATGEQP